MRDVRGPGGRLRRQYIVAAAIFAVLLVVSIGSFAHLIDQQLSKSFMEEILLSGQEQAEELAKQFKGGGNG